MEPESVHGPMPGEGVDEKPPARNFFSRLIGVYVSPKETFTEIGRSPGVWLPIIIVVILGLLSTYWITQKIDMRASMEAQLEQAVAQGTITEEQMEQQLAMVGKVGPAFTIIMAGISSLLICLIIAGFMKLISMFAGAENRFKALLAVSLYSTIAVSLIQSVLLILILQLKHPGEVDAASIRSVIASNLGAVLAGLFGAESIPRFVMGLANGVDIFNIWLIALLAIGCAAVSTRMKTSTAAVWLGGAYVLIILIASAFRALMG